MIDYTNFQKSLKNLEKFWTRHRQRNWASVPEKESFMHKLCIIKAYSICYVQLTRSLKDHLGEETEVLDSPDGVKLVLQSADKAGLLHSPIEQWFGYVDMHERTSDGRFYESADEAIGILPEFIDAATDLYQSMTGNNGAGSE